jgi:HEAT repeat protein
MTPLGIRCVLLLGLLPGIPPGAVNAPDDGSAEPVLRDGPPMPVLLAWLRSEDSDARVEAARELNRMGREAREAIPALVEASRRRFSERTRMAALTTLCLLDCPEATTRIREMIEDVGGRSSSSWTDLRQLGDVGHQCYLNLILEPRCQVVALSLLERRLGEVLPVLLAGLDNTDPALRQSAALGLTRLGGDWSKAALPRLLKALDDRDQAVRLHAAWAVWLLEEKPERVMPHLCSALRHDDTAIRLASANYLMQMESRAAAAAPGLVEALGDSDLLVADRAERALTSIGTPALTDLLLGMRAGNDRRRRAALGVLRAIATKSEEVVPALMPLLDDEDLLLRVHTARMVASLDPARRPAAVSALIGALIDRRSNAARIAIESLADLGPDARAAVPALLAQLDDSDRAYALAAAGALITIDPRSTEAALPVVIEAMASNKSSIRRAVLASLEKMGPAAADAVPAVLTLLKRSLDDSDVADPEDVMRALVKLGGGPSALPMLLDALGRGRSGRGGPGRGGYYSYPVTACLMMLRDDAIPALIAIYQNGDRRTSRMASSLLRRISQSTN